MAICLASALVAEAPPVLCATPGRAWTGVEKLSLPTHSYLVTDLLDTDMDGIPVMIGGGHGGIGRRIYGFSWLDTSWQKAWDLPFGAAYIRSCGTRQGQQHLIWAGIEAGFGDYGFLKPLLMAWVDDPAAVHHDTVTYIEQSQYPYAGAAGRTRRWAVVSDVVHGPPYGRLDLRLLYSDSIAAWNEVEVAGLGDRGVAVAPLDDTTALVVWAGHIPTQPDGDERLRWGILRGDQWFPSAERVDDRLADAVPMLRARPSGGYWVSWAAYDPQLLFRTFRDGAWAERDTLDCAYRTSDPYFPQSNDISRDGGEYPAAAWSAWNSRRGGWSICASVPTDSGLGVADHLQGTEDGLGPRVARDKNGDVWLAWWKMWDGIFWRHTYSTATASPPRISWAGKQRLVSWTLSEPAPETWWAVLRADKRGQFESVARVRADRRLEMSWSDATPPRGVVRYRIRRESVDKRYEWASEESRWPGVGHKPVLVLLDASPQVKRTRFRVEGAARGALRLDLYDVQGRVVHTAEFPDGRVDSLELDLTRTRESVTPGVYFARIMDADGRASDAVKLVLLP